MRMAFIVGVDYYEVASPLYGCVSDARAVEAVLKRHGDGAPNFDCRLLVGTGQGERVTRAQIKDGINELFSTDTEIALFYFAGHGHIEGTGGYIIASNSERGDDGLALADILTLANASPARNKIVILDSCHSGIAGNAPSAPNVAALHRGIDRSHRIHQGPVCEREKWSRRVHDALCRCPIWRNCRSGRSYHSGKRVRSHRSVARGVGTTACVQDEHQAVRLDRDVPPPISLAELRQLTELFPSPGFDFRLDPTFETRDERPGPRNAAAQPENTRKFAVLQKYNRLNLLVPVGAPHMWARGHAKQVVKLTALGEHYRRLVEKNRI